MQAQTHYIDLQLLNVALRLISPQEKVLDFITRFTGLPTQNKMNSDPNIHVNLEFTKQIQIEKHYNKISRNIWLDHSSVLVTEIPKFPTLSLEVNMKDSKLYVNAFLSDKKTSKWKDILNYIAVSDKHKLYNLIALTYYLVYFPLAYYLERFSNLFLLHASAFEYGQYAVILSGLGGVGKSTFSLATLSLEGSKVISDNLIFHDTKNIYSFPEPIALDPKSINMLATTEQILIPQQIASGHNRLYYHLRPENRSHRATAKYLFWLQSGNENKLTPVDTPKCIKNVLNINLLANELREYYLIAAMFDLALPQPLAPDSYLNNLTNLLENIDCFILEFKPGDDIETIFAESRVDVIL